AIHTGDVFEYSLVDETWEDFTLATAEMQCPLCYVAGNHDNTWGEINNQSRESFGGDNFSFDYGDYHFICLNSAGLLEPLPYFDRATLDWLRADLDHTPQDRLLFLAMHHPLTDNAGYASEFEKLRLWNLLKGRRIALIMDGHWHIVHCKQWQQIDRVNGGATFGPHT